MCDGCFRAWLHEIVSCPVHGPKHTDVCLTHRQTCPTCSTELACEWDYYGGGSHYWELRCINGHGTFYYDTYRFSLDAAP